MVRTSLERLIGHASGRAGADAILHTRAEPVEPDALAVCKSKIFVRRDEPLLATPRAWVQIPEVPGTRARVRTTMGDDVQDFDVTLRDGRRVQVRAVRPSDEAEFLQAFERLSAEARYMRFMRSVRELDRDRLHKALTSLPEKGIGIVASVPADDGYDIVGSAIAVITGDGTRCEFAITVAGEFGGCGLATTLMKVLIDAASRRGLAEMEGFVLSINQPMLKLARRLGFDVQYDPDDASVRICRLRLAPPEAPEQLERRVEVVSDSPANNLERAKGIEPSS